MPKKLSTQHANFCLLMAGGNINQTHAYMECYPDSKYEIARDSASKLHAKPVIASEIKRLQGLTESSKTLSRTEKREYHARVIRADPSDLGENDGDLIDTIQRTTRRTKDGEEIESETIRLCSKPKILDMDNKMQGDYEPDQVEHNINITWGQSV